MVTGGERDKETLKNAEIATAGRKKGTRIH